MTMKKIFYSVALLLALAACSDEDYNSAFREYAGIKTTGVATSIAEDAAGTVNIPVVYGGTLDYTKSYTVNYTVTGGDYGDDYTIDGGTSASGTVTLAPNDTKTQVTGLIKINPTADFLTEPNVVLTIELTSADGGLQVGYPYAKKFTLTLQDDDCDYVFDTFVGDAASKEVYSDGSTYPSGTNTYVTAFTEVDENTVEIDNFWDSGMVLSLDINGANRTVTVVERTWAQYGFDWNVTGTGTISTCGKTMSVQYHLTSPNYSGGYDDTFTINYKF
jgi:hypothetical protein